MILFFFFFLEYLTIFIFIIINNKEITSNVFILYKKYRIAFCVFFTDDDRYSSKIYNKYDMFILKINNCRNEKYCNLKNYYDYN